jgi:hypothetical protein
MSPVPPMTIKPEEICGESTVLQQRSKDEVLFLGKLLFSPFYVYLHGLSWEIKIKK